MTRDEAIKIVATAYCAEDASILGAPVVNALIALGVLKVETPEDATRAAAHDRLQKIMTETVSGGVLSGNAHVGVLSAYGAGCIVSGLEAAGLKIVRTKD